MLSNEGGALKEFKKPLNFGVAAILGDGDQVTSWVHIDDLCRAFLFAIEQRTLEGTFNLVAPNPVDNKTLTLTLAQKRKGKAFVQIKVPSSMLKLALGELSVEILKSATVSSKKSEPGLCDADPRRDHGARAALDEMGALRLRHRRQRAGGGAERRARARPSRSPSTCSPPSPPA